MKSMGKRLLVAAVLVAAPVLAWAGEHMASAVCGGCCGIPLCPCC